MKYLIRTDASTAIGSGHVMRCLTIAKALKESGHDIVFWSLPLPGHLNTYISEQGFPLVTTVISVDVLIIDHYDLDIQFEQTMRQYAKKIVVIDDLANRQHDCDMLIDQNLLPNYEVRYKQLVSDCCIQLLGPKYLIMRPEFVEARQLAKKRTGQINRLLIFMGGSDPTYETMKILEAFELEKINFQHIDVVVGSSNPLKEQIELKCKTLHLHYHCQINYIAELMRLADFSIGAGGSTIWERCFVGLPSAVTVVASNQQETTEMVRELQALDYLGWHEEVTISTYRQCLKNLSHMQKEIAFMSEQAFEITEAIGNINPWLDEIVGLL